MGFSTWLGPLRAGTVKDTTGTTVGTIENTGIAVLSQSAALGLTTAATTIVIPAGSQIDFINIDVTTSFTSGATLAVGDGTTVDKYVTAIITPAVGRQAITLTAAQIAAWYNVGTSDVQLTITMAGTTATAGAGYITAIYSLKDSSGNESPKNP